jgi:hypothetical protein
VDFRLTDPEGTPNMMEDCLLWQKNLGMTLLRTKFEIGGRNALPILSANETLDQSLAFKAPF